MPEVTCWDCGLPINLSNRPRHASCFPQHRRADLNAAALNRCTITLENGERCPKPMKARDWCSGHIQRYGRYGDPTFVTGRRANGEMQALVRAAARAVTEECILAPCAHSRPGVIYRGNPMPAARAVWIEATGENPGDRQVLHTCHRGDEGCIAFPHLYLGDHARNMRDMTEAERQGRGEDNGNAELTELDVREIRRLFAARAASQRALAAQFGVSQGAIHQIVTRKTWKHVE
ncbi:hypothetical protein [Streptomyces sp. NPDC056291]|uniref:hypothetical protein n=1 Tax=Streptomyces sp. NPDC056291 TaxID=3345772 RepID=UPI0035DFCBCE